MTNSSILWVNSESIILLGSPSFFRKITVPIPETAFVPPNSTKTAYLSVQSASAITSAQFGHHYSNCSQSGAGWSVENALALIPGGNIQFLNSISTPDPLYLGPSSDGGTFNNIQEGEARLGYSAFILDLDTKEIKDFTSIHNGFYNPSLLGGIMGNYNCNFTVY
jgi:hypothetical protein